MDGWTNDNDLDDLNDLDDVAQIPVTYSDVPPVAAVGTIRSNADGRGP